jgi:hypothetical protein
LIFDNYTPTPVPSDVLPPSHPRKVLADARLGEDSLSVSLSQDLEELRQQLQYAKKQTLVMMEQSRKASEAEKIALQQVQEAMAAKENAVSEAEKATTRENLMLELMNEAGVEMSGMFFRIQTSSVFLLHLLFLLKFLCLLQVGSFLDAAAEEERVNARTNLLVNLSLDHGS